MENVKVTSLHQAHINLGAKMVEFAGFDMPIVYTSIKDEHEAVRHHVGMFDVSHMGEITVVGEEAQAFMEFMFTNKVSSMYEQQINYGMMLYPNGTVVDDLLVYKVNQHHFFLVVNASNIEKDFQYLLENKDGYRVDIKNVSHQYSEIALQGPKAQEMMLKALKIDLQDLKFFHFNEYAYEGQTLLISRTGYTGEDGFEIYGNHQLINQLWGIFLDNSVTPCGLGSRDTLRFEANLPLYGHEISQEITPIEAGLKYFVKIDEDINFLGKEALLSGDVVRRVVGLELEQKSIPREGYLVFKDEKEIGYITTGYLSISLDKPVALAMINRPYTKQGTKVFVQIRNKKVPGFIRDRKFLKDIK